MDFPTRLKGALSLLLGRGDDGTVCSFCGENRRAVEVIIAGPAATAICNRCIFVCNQVMLENSGPPGFRRHAEKGHETSIAIPLAHDEVLLGAPERIALEQMLHALVGSLPQSRLIGWSYMHSEDRFDLLTIEILTTSGMQPNEISSLAQQNWRQMRDRFVAARNVPANREEPDLIAIGAAATQAAGAYAKAVGSLEPTAY
ncbi:ClpX C4-type zinc finger protein [Neorhizobium vignae]|uniref:ClpX C4-type zinc finger protein n=1 Tax=Neorhizobium vignae TaxID=690585 RepID=UPI000559F71D|nr:ClpX C4-type zinc finger protein [Neorhizobium vignae]